MPDTQIVTMSDRIDEMHARERSNHAVGPPLNASAGWNSASDTRGPFGQLFGQAPKANVPAHPGIGHMWG